MLREDDMELLTQSAAEILKRDAMAGPVSRRDQQQALARLLRAWLTLSLWLSVPPLVGELHAQRQDKVLEYQVKAAYLLNFTKFVEWPAAAFPAPDTPITICVLGEDPFGSILDRTVRGESVNGREVRVLRSVPEANPHGCHVAFISRSERTGITEIVSGLRRSSVLTVSELPGFADQGGAIEFTLQDGKVQFEINAIAAETAGLKLSSQLLRVAKEVKGSRA